jgi:hypothetical protein
MVLAIMVSPPSMRASSSTRSCAQTAATELSVAFLTSCLRTTRWSVGTRSHLGQVGDGQHLTIQSKLTHQAPDGLCHRASDTSINFVKDQCLGSTQLTGGDGDGQCNA